MSRKIVWIEAAIMATLAMIFSFVPDIFGWFSPSFGAVVVVIFALRRGLTPALASGFLWGGLHLVLGKATFLSVGQVVVDYMIACTSLGIAGIFYHSFQKQLRKNQLKGMLFWAITASIISITCCYIWHFIAGMLFWQAYVPKGISPVAYSLLVNGIAGGQTIAVCIAVVVVLLRYPVIYRTYK